tara:strand:+ start:44019 stop:44291 length:273 start_codon:yes stop_codon:yes gene_type:complete
MATIRIHNWKSRKVINMRASNGKRVVVFTNKYAKVPNNIYNLGAQAFKGWMKKQENLRLVKVYENDEVMNFSLVTKDYYNKHKKLYPWTN